MRSATCMGRIEGRAGSWISFEKGDQLQPQLPRTTPEERCSGCGTPAEAFERARGSAARPFGRPVCYLPSPLRCGASGRKCGPPRAVDTNTCTEINLVMESRQIYY
jgi:hypothetical protein